MSPPIARLPSSRTRSLPLPRHHQLAANRRQPPSSPPLASIAAHTSTSDRLLPPGLRPLRHRYDVHREQALGALDLLVGDGLAHAERAKPFARDRGVMDECVRAVIGFDEPVALGVAELRNSQHRERRNRGIVNAETAAS